VAHIARCDIHNSCAIYAAASTITSEAIISSQILATSFVIFNNIHLDVSLTQGTLFLNTIITNNNNNTATKISLTLSIHSTNSKFPPLVFIFINENKKTHKKRYKKFLIFGTETSIFSSDGDSFFTIRYQLYHAKSQSNIVHSQSATF
jgi:hypothetical protein